MSGTPGSWMPDYGYNPAVVVTAKETQLSALRTAIGAGTFLTYEQAWHMAARMPGSAISDSGGDLSDLYYCAWHWGSH